jgi:hypothetical protein
MLELGGTVAGAAVGGPLGAAAGKFIFSSRKYKKDIEPTTAKDEKAALRVVSGLKTFSYRYKEESPETPRRLGLMADSAPAEIVTPDREGLDVGRLVGLLTVATKALAERGK